MLKGLSILCPLYWPFFWANPILPLSSLFYWRSFVLSWQVFCLKTNQPNARYHFYLSPHPYQAPPTLFSLGISGNGGGRHHPYDGHIQIKGGFVTVLLHSCATLPQWHCSSQLIILLAYLSLLHIIISCDVPEIVGRIIGGPKLAPAISPGKTISGALGIL